MSIESLRQHVRAVGDTKSAEKGLARTQSYATSCSSGDPMLREDPPDLADNGGMVLTQMAGRHEQLGRRPFQMRTSYGTRPSLPPALGGSRRSAMMEWALIVGASPSSFRPHEDRRLPLQFVDAGGQALAEAFREEVRAIAGHEPLVGRPEWVGEADEP